MSRLTRRQWLLAGGGLVATLGLTVAVLGFVPRVVALNYAGETCASTVSLLPDAHQNVDDTVYRAEFADKVRIGSVDLLARQVCFTPQQAPQEGEATVATALLGTLIGRQTYKVVSEAPPGVSQAAFAEAIPTTKPLKVELEAPDKLHKYDITVAKQQADCQAQDQARLECDIAALELKQGAQYPYELRRQFKGGDAQTVAAGDIETLRAVEVVERSVEDGAVVYDRPAEFTFVTDKPVKSVKATLKQNEQTIELEPIIDGRTISLQVEAELERRADYSLTLQTVEAEDGATLVEPLNIGFYLSDGPLVSGISIGGARVALNQAIIVSFDQPLAEQDLAKHISVQGAGATVSSYGPTQALVQLVATKRCQPFTITVSKGLRSQHDIVSSQDWHHASRTICHTVSTYGTSVNGRALLAYHFGSSGPVTMYVGAIHGNESSSMGILQAWINELEANPSRIGNRQIVVIPNINPDGIAAGTRANSRGVNLNRNFPTSNWVSDIRDTDGTHSGGGGTKPLSEPEANALASITSRYRPRLLVSYHAIGSLVIGDPGGFSAGKASQYAGMVGYRNATGMSATFDYDITGAYEDWTYRNLGIPSMIVELGSYSYYNFAHHRAAFWAMLD